MTLTFVTPEEVAQTSANISALLYGPEGVGKTVAAASAPGPILYLNGDAPDALRFARRKFVDKDFREVRVTGRESIEQAYLYAREGNGVATVVLDTMGSIYDKVLRDLAKDDKRPTQPEFGDTQTFLARYVEAFLELPVNVVLVAHDMPVQMTGAEAEGTAGMETLPYMGTQKSGFGNKIMRPLAVVAYCGRIPPEKEGGESRYVGQLVHGGGRRGKDRTGVLADSRGIAELDLTAWAHLVAVAYSANGKSSNQETK